MSNRYLIHASNRLRSSIRYVDGSSLKYDPDGINDFFSVACDALRDLANDSKSIKHIVDGYNQAPNEIYEQFGDFMGEFVGPDIDLMVEAGMDRKVVDYLFNDIDEMLKSVFRKDFVGRERMSAYKMHEKIVSLQLDICRVKKIHDKRKLLKRALGVIGGSAVIVVNVSAESAIGSIPSAFSTSYGAWLAGNGLNG
ncbi:MAG: hypothetical protein K6L60_07425 [Oceanobacter sp.]